LFDPDKLIWNINKSQIGVMKGALSAHTQLTQLVQRLDRKFDDSFFMFSELDSIRQRLSDARDPMTGSRSTAEEIFKRAGLTSDATRVRDESMALYKISGSNVDLVMASLKKVVEKGP